MTATNRVMKIRSLLNVRLPKYFPPDVLIWNRYSAADALLVDVRQKADELATKTDWKRNAVLKALDGKPFAPRVFVMPTMHSHNEKTWATDVRATVHPKLNGAMLRSVTIPAWEEANQLLRITDHQLGQQGGQGVEETELLSAPIPKHTGWLMDVKQRRITHVILQYTNHGETARPTQCTRMADLVERAKEEGISTLAWRQYRCNNMKMIAAEMRSLRQLGVEGVILRDPDLVPMANDIFD